MPRVTRSLSLLSVLVATVAHADPAGTVRGKVIDTLSEEGLPAATIQVKGGADGDQTLASELDGTFLLQLAPGTYTITFATPEFIEVSRTITVVADQTLDLSLGLEPMPKTATGETIEITGTIDTRKESAVLAVRRAAATVSDAIGSQEIGKTPDSNAGDAMKRVVAVSVVDGKYVALRGLEGRYATTLLNGVLLPSPEPDRNAVPLDLFPTNLLATMTVYKSYSAELPGQFGGGALAIATSSLPTSFEMRLGVSTFASTAATGQQALSDAHTTGLSSFLGFDSGDRRLPAAIPRDRAVRGMAPSQMEQIGESLPNVWTPRSDTVTPNLGLNATIGDSFKLGGKRVGYLASGMMRHSFAVREGTSVKTSLVGGELNKADDLSYRGSRRRHGRRARQRRHRSRRGPSAQRARSLHARRRGHELAGERLQRGRRFADRCLAAVVRRATARVRTAPRDAQAESLARAGAALAGQRRPEWTRRARQPRPHLHRRCDDR